MTFSQTMIRELRSLRVAVFHPPETDRDELMLHIRRIGCTVYADWPIPPLPARETDIALCLLSETGAALPDWPEVSLIAILEYESPIIVRSLLDSNAHGIVSKSSISRHSRRTVQRMHTRFADLVELPFSGNHTSGSACAQRADAAHPIVGSSNVVPPHQSG